jgi:hypothetical protein
MSRMSKAQSSYMRVVSSFQSSQNDLEQCYDTDPTLKRMLAVSLGDSIWTLCLRGMR